MMSKVECVLEVMVAGGTYNAENPASTSFWNTIRKYAKADTNTVTLTAAELLTLAKEVYPQLTALPAIPEGYTGVVHIPADAEAGTAEQYKLTLSALAGLEMTTSNVTANSFTVTVIQGGETLVYKVTYDGDNISSIVKQ